MCRKTKPNQTIDYTLTDIITPDMGGVMVRNVFSTFPTCLEQELHFSVITGDPFYGATYVRERVRIF